VKTTPMPESVKNRPSSATEEIFFFAKQPGYYYDNQAVRERSGANLRNCWMLGSSTGSASHPAVFPHELARRCILLGSRPGDVVLDPFSGSGTTGIVAVELRRNFSLGAGKRGTAPKGPYGAGGKNGTTTKVNDRGRNR
jgi:site-specific DNA-methyltransferase (cytosine-N4-specific)